MANQRLDLLFQSVDGYGWSESYYYAPGNLTAPNLNVLNLINFRLLILANDAQLTYIRLASGYSRSPYLFEGAYPASGSADGNSGATSGPDFVSLSIRLQASPAGVGRIFMRGIPEENYTGDQYLPTVPYAAAVNDFSAYLAGGSLWAVRSSTSNVPIPRYAAASLLPLSPRGYTFTVTDMIAGLGVGSYIRMHQAQIVGYNGLKKVTKALGDGPYIYYVGGAAPQVADPGTNSPYITVPNYQYPLISTALPERISRRNSGRFFGQRRGRRSTTLSLRQ